MVTSGTSKRPVIHDSNSASRLLLARLHGLADEHLSVTRSRDRAFDEEQVLLGIDSRDLEVEHTHQFVSVLARHLETWERAPWGHVRTDRSTVTAVLMRTVRHVLAFETPATKNAREPAAAGATLCVDLLADLEELVELENTTHFELVSEGCLAAQLFQLALRRRVGLLVVTKLWLRSVLLFALTEAKDEGAVAIALDGALVDDGDGSCFDNGHALHGAVVVEDLCAAEFDSDHAGLLIHDGLLSCALEWQMKNRFGVDDRGYFVRAVSSGETGDL